ncbi:MAG: mannosyltransferase [Phormidesmis priestleyi]|uniref:Mannosyltransferase n=1 Tax=Phormidesmis priestleyi TaxID=268141 RepID=A0A2W4XQ40_9CYAN|nr:MAG: mannosyltransferase [Phormidesmis priestleyi]
MNIEPSPSSLLVNLSILMDQPTGISVYIQNLLPFIHSLDPVLFSAKPISGFRCQSIPQGLSPAFGNQGHLKRLCWLQQKIPNYYRQLGHQSSNQSGRSLIFSPSPEAPIWSGCRFVVMAHDTIPLRFPQTFSPYLVGYFRYYVGRVLAQAEHVICNSVSTANDVKKFYGVPTPKITPIPLAYDQQNFRPGDQPLGNYFLYVGRQAPYKNLYRLVAAFHQVCATNHNLELWLVGPQDQRYTPALKAKIASLGIESQVRFLDYVAYEQLPVLLRGALALTLPSLWEGFGLPVLEAMACGTPVITSNLSSLPEVAGDAAILVDPYNTDDIANAMKMVAKDADLRAQLSIAGLAQAQKFSWQKTGEQTADVIRKFL